MATAGRTRILVLVGLLVCLVLSGCVQRFEETDNGVTIRYSGAGPGSQRLVLDCIDGEGLLSIQIDGSGPVSVRVNDPQGFDLYWEDINATDDGTQRTLTGVPGDWSLSVSREATFSGTYEISLRCHERIEQP